MPIGKLDKTQTALIIIDMQNAFIHPDGSIARMGLSIERTGRPIEPIRKLADEFRRLKAPVIYIAMSLEEDFCDAGIMCEVFPQLRELGHVVKDSWDAEIIEELKPRKGDHIVEKNRFSGFFNTKLEILLRELEAENLVVTGISTNICVESTIRDAFYRDFRVYVPRDATAAYTAEQEEASIANFKFGFARMTTTDEVIQSLG